MRRQGRNDAVQSRAKHDYADLVSYLRTFRDSGTLLAFRQMRLSQRSTWRGSNTVIIVSIEWIRSAATQIFQFQSNS